MKRKIIITLSLLATLVLSALIAWPKILDEIRDRRHGTYLAAKKENPLRWRSTSFFQVEDTPDGWVNVLEQFKTPRIGAYQSETYRFLLFRMGRSGVITVVLGSAPHWEETIVGELPRKGTLSRWQASRIRSMVTRCHFWSLEDYVASHGADGEDWIFEGCLDGRYRRITDWCPERTSYVYALCTTLAAATDSSLTTDER